MKAKKRSVRRRSYRKHLVILAVLLIIGMICGMKILIDSRKEDDIMQVEPSKTEQKEEQINNLVLEMLKRMSLEQKVGQMLVIRNLNTEMTPELEEDLMALQPGGYIVFNENITTLAGTKQFIDDSREVIEQAGTVVMDDETIVKIPVLMSVDQEGGLVQRLQAITDETPEFVPAMAEIGASGSLDKAYEVGRLLAEECKSVGLNVDFAPVVDIFSNPENTVIGERAFGSDKDTVAKMAVKVAQGLSDGGVVPVYKHFPGHGDTVADSHFALPVVSKSLEELEQNELYPFRKAIEAGAEMMMVAHIALPNITGDNTPASLSPMIISEVLRGRLGFKGIVVTDGLDMGALTENYSNAEIAVKAVEAGADLLLTPVSPLEARDAILTAVRDGVLSEERIDESVGRILRMKLEKL